MKRKIVKIDEEKCDGCGLCVPSCAEGAIKVIDGKARLIGEILCDGLGACLGECPQGAITIEEREAEAFDEQAVKRHLAEDRPDPSKLQDTEPPKPAPEFKGCPGALSQMLRSKDQRPQTRAAVPQDNLSAAESQLANWPIQMNLVPVQAPYFQGARLLIAADCVPFALADFHQRYLADKILLIGCPKLDNAPHYREKLAAIFSQNQIESIEVVYMQVPCCFGLVQIVKQSIADAGKDIPLSLVKIGLRGEVLEELTPEAVQAR